MPIALPSGGLLHRSGPDTGRPLLLLHGVAGAKWSWEPQRAAFAHERPVYVWEARGHGDAARVADAGFADYLTDAREALAVVQAQHGRDVTVAGHSMGGLLATILAADRAFEGALVLVDPVYNEENDAHVDRRWRRVANTILAPLKHSTQRGGWLARTLGRRMFHASFKDRAQAERWWPYQVAQVPFEYPRMFDEGIGGVTGVRFRPFVRDIVVPTLLVNGHFAPLRDGLNAGLGTRFRHAVIDGGHYTQLDRPDDVIAAMRAFETEVAPAP